MATKKDSNTNLYIGLAVASALVGWAFFTTKGKEQKDKIVAWFKVKLS